MGTFKWPVRIASTDGQQVRDIEATVDTGASFTTLPSRLLREPGVEATGKRGFLLADGRRIEMAYGEARATINGDSVTTIVVFGEDEAPPLLGAYTLEGLALAVDPEAQRLVPTHMILYQGRHSPVDRDVSQQSSTSAWLRTALRLEMMPKVCTRTTR